jgi:hypothetical protein
MHIMQFSRSDLADFTYFLAIARHRNFRKAGLELGNQRFGPQPCPEGT